MSTEVIVASVDPLIAGVVANAVWIAVAVDEDGCRGRPSQPAPTIREVQPVTTRPTHRAGCAAGTARPGVVARSGARRRGGQLAGLGDRRRLA